MAWFQSLDYLWLRTQKLIFECSHASLNAKILELLQSVSDPLAESFSLTGPADDYSSVVYHWDEDYLQQKYEIFDLKIIQRRRRTGFEECKDIVLHVNDLIAGRYQARPCSKSKFETHHWTLISGGNMQAFLLVNIWATHLFVKISWALSKILWVLT